MLYTLVAPADSEGFQTQATVLVGSLAASLVDVLVDMTAVVLILSSGTVFIVCASVHLCVRRHECVSSGKPPPPLFLKGSASLIESGSSLRAGRGDLAAQRVIIAAAGQIN